MLIGHHSIVLTAVVNSSDIGDKLMVNVKRILEKKKIVLSVS